MEHCCVRLRDAVVALNTSRHKKPTFTLTDKHGMELLHRVVKYGPSHILVFQPFPIRHSISGVVGPGFWVKPHFLYPIRIWMDPKLHDIDEHPCEYFQTFFCSSHSVPISDTIWMDPKLHDIDEHPCECFQRFFCSSHSVPISDTI